MHMARMTFGRIGAALLTAKACMIYDDGMLNSLRFDSAVDNIVCFFFFERGMLDFRYSQDFQFNSKCTSRYRWLLIQKENTPSPALKTELFILNVLTLSSSILI